MGSKNAVVWDIFVLARYKATLWEKKVAIAKYKFSLWEIKMQLWEIKAQFFFR